MKNTMFSYDDFIHKIFANVKRFGFRPSLACVTYLNETKKVEKVLKLSVSICSVQL